MSSSKKLLAVLSITAMILFCGSSFDLLPSFAATDSVSVQEETENTEETTTEATEETETTEATEATEGTEPQETEETEPSDEPTDVEEDVLKERNIKADVVAESLYKDKQKKQKTEAYSIVSRFWKALTGRKAVASEDDMDLKVTVSGKLPESVTARCTLIPMEDQAVFTEQGLFSLELTLLDENGDPFIPEEAVKVTVRGKALKQEIGDDCALLLYTWAQAPERAEKYSKKYDRDVYAADVEVYKSKSVKDKLLSYDVYNKNRNYKDGEDAVRCAENKDGLRCGSDEVAFAYDYEAFGKRAEAGNTGSIRFLVSAQMGERTLKATSGKAEITVTGPLDKAVTLEVDEITKKDGDYKDYMKKTAETLDMKASEFSFARAFDIRLIDPDTGEEFQPDSEVKVSIDLKNEKLDKQESVDVVHISGEKNEEPEVMDADAKGNTVSFATEGFSVYVVVGTGGEIVTHTWSYRFFVPKAGVDPGEREEDEYYVIDNWTSKYDQESVKTESGTASVQTIKGGEKPVVPQQPMLEGKSFAGWYRGTLQDDGSVHLSKTDYDFNGIPKTLEDDQTIDIFARYSNEYTVYFHDQYNADLDNYPIASSRRGEVKNSSATVKISDVSAVYSGGSDMGFYGWSEEPIRTPGEGKDKKITTDTITIDGNKDLYPIFQPIHWLYYYSAEAGSGATYVPTRSFFAEDYENKLQVPVWEGHTFEGWYTGTLDGDRVLYSVPITDADGSILNFDPALAPGLVCQGGKLYVTGDTTLYAKWSDQTTVDYKIIIWRQKTTDGASLPVADRTYDFYESVIKTVPQGSPATIDAEYKEYATDGNHSDLTNYVCRSDADVNPADPNGYTVLNVYYDRDGAYVPSGEKHSLVFDDSTMPKADGLPVNYMGANAVEYGTNMLTGNNGGSFVPADPKKDNFTFTGWFADKNCTTQVFFDRESLDAYTGYNKTMLCDVMPDSDLTLYAGWEADWYLVQVDPNYGTFNGSGGTWFWETYDGDLVQEYTQTTRDYVESSSGEYYYVKKDRAYYGYTGYEWDKSETDRQTKYITNPSEATEDTTFEKASGVYSYAGWYEVNEDGSETPYDFSKHVDHHTTIKLHWKRNGIYYVHYNTTVTEGSQTLEGQLSGSQDGTAYCDDADVSIGCSAIAPSGYTFAGWKIRGDSSGRVYSPSQSFQLPADRSVMVGGKKTVYLDAVYVKAGMAKIIYDANGGSVDPDVEGFNYGRCKDGTLPRGTANVEEGTATASEIPNNAEFTLSDGTGFFHEDATFLGWSNKAVYDPRDKDAEFYEAGVSDRYGVDKEGSGRLYAVWGVKVTYHKNNDNANWSEDGDAWGDPYQSETIGGEQVYTQYAYLGAPVDEPNYTPTFTGTGSQVFYNWRTGAHQPGHATGDDDVYDFSTPVTEPLDLYAYWSGPSVRNVHAIDASSETLAEKTSADTGWTVPENMDVGASATQLASWQENQITVPGSYRFAFAAAHDASAGLESISEDEAVTEIKYDSKGKAVAVKYEGKTSFTDLEPNDEIYFIYYKEKQLDIGYESMGADGALTTVSGIAAAAPDNTGTLAADPYDMAANVTSPLDWNPDTDAAYYAYAIGSASATDAGDLNFITDSSNSDSSRPALKVQNTWKGFRYSTDGGTTWTNCGYAPQLYVVYYTKKPTVIVFGEKTVGTSAVMGEEFTYHVKVTQTVKTGGQEETTTLFDTDDPGNSPYHLKNGESQSAILFYSSAGESVTTQTITIRQEVKPEFSAYVAEDGGTPAQGDSWTYTSTEAGGTKNVIFSNEHKSLPVEVHVAVADENGYILRDDLRSENTEDYSFDLPLRGDKALGTEPDPNRVFAGNSAYKPEDYALGAVVCGTNGSGERPVIDPASLNVSDISYRQETDNIYELMLKDNGGQDWYDLGSRKIYYLYYRMPKISYVKEMPDGTLKPVEGSPDGQSVTEDITYNFESITMNGQLVTQGQGLAVPQDGLLITQNGSVKDFRMPQILDDEIHARYLKYAKIGAGRDSITKMDDLSPNVSDELKLHLQVRDNKLMFSFDGASWSAFPAGTVPTIYAVYEERGYDLEITKSVPDVGLSGTPTFTLELVSEAITKESYGVQGYSESTIETTPVGSSKRKIELTIQDGTDVKIIGLGQGSYDVKEKGSRNYILTAVSRPISGGDPVTLEVTDSEDRTEHTLELGLDVEKRLELTNSSRPICKITNNGREIPFYSIQSAVEYVKTELSASETIEMLTDYDMPATDVPVIPSGYSIRLTTAATEGGTYNYDGEGSTATIMRARDNTDQYLISNNNGTLTLDNIFFDGRGVEASKALIHSTGALAVSGVTMENAVNSGNGGAIYMESGAVTLTNSTFRNNTADKGGAIYSTGNGITVKTEDTGRTRFTGNSAGSGGAIYYDGASTGVIDLSGATTFGGSAASAGNRATTGDGGAIYASSGTVKVADGVAFSANAADSGNGGAIYTGNGSVEITGGTFGGQQANTARNGAAVYVNTGRADISGGRITGNTASDGGAVGVGSSSARLYFSGKPYISGNTCEASLAPGKASNVYLDQDTDAVINAEGLSRNQGGIPNIGVYVPNKYNEHEGTEILFSHRGLPGCKFGRYTNVTNLAAFHNDRLSTLTAHEESVTMRIMWGKSIQVQVRYLASFSDSANGFPGKTDGTWNGTQKYPAQNWATYDLPSNDNKVSSIADDLRSKYSLGLTNTAAFACAFLDDGEQAIPFDNYLTDVNWANNDWQFVGRDGSVSTGDKLVVYFAEPTYITIENNTSFNMDHSDLTMLGHHAVNSENQTGYGYVFAVNGKLQDALVPITEDQLKLNRGKSIKLMFPGGTNKNYTMTGGFAVGSSGDSIPVTQDGVPNIPDLTGADRENFTLDQGKTGSTVNTTVRIVFGGGKPICKIVTGEVTLDPADSVVGTDEEASGTAYLFARLTDAVAFAQRHGLTGATIQLLVDYMIPGSDVVNNIPASGYNLTFTTAIGDTENDYNYSSDPTARATISRDESNADSFINVTGSATAMPTLTVENLIFDRKNFSGTNDGGLIKTKDVNVVIRNMDFLNSTASNGGGIFVNYTETGTGGTLTVTDSRFDACHSSGTSRRGGGAIWTTARIMTVTNTTFNDCTGTDQGGAIFHRIDSVSKSGYTRQSYATESTSIITGCTFTNCKSRSGGAVESDAHHITVDGCAFTDCESKKMEGNNNTGSGGAINTYIYEGSGGSLGRTYPTYLTVRNTTFTNCKTTAGDGNTRGHGGGIRSTSLYNVIENCTFTDCEARYDGGAICINNNEAYTAEIIGCTITGCKARNGGGVYVKVNNMTTDPMMLTINGGTISDNTADTQGGGVWTNAAMTLKNNAQITGNHLLTAMMVNGAGVFINDKTLTVGTTGATEHDLSSITGNTVAGGVASNLRMWNGNNVASVSVLSDLGGKIGVVNPGAIRTQFGSAPNATPDNRPYGLSDPNASDPSYEPTFYADDRSTYGIIDRSDPNGKKIIWAAPPICKITDLNGDILYLDAAGNYPAIFDQLDNAGHNDNGGWSAAFACLRNPTLYDKNGNVYPNNDASKPFYVKMLVENYEAKNYITTTNNASNRTIIVTTAEPKSKNTDGYYYRGSSGTYATIVKSTSIAANNLLTARYNMTFENITLDGGYNPASSTSVITTTDGGLIDMREPAGVKVIIGNNATLQNAYTTGNGGAIVVKNGDLIIRGNGTITNCIAEKKGGAVYLSSVNEGKNAISLTIEDGAIRGCSAANGGAVYMDSAKGSFVMSGGKIQDCTATTGNGGGVYQGKGTGFTMSSGTISGCNAVNGSGGGVFVNNNMTFTMSNAFITGNHAKNAGGGIAVGGNGARLVFFGAPNVSGNKSDASVVSDKTCNLELGYGFTYKAPDQAEWLNNTVIRSNRLNSGARIGVYVPDRDNLYTNHGDEGDPFGTFTSSTEVGTLYGFINDRNGLKGGLGTGQNATNNNKIYWIKIFSLEVEKQVDSFGEYQADDTDQVFRFRVTLRGQADDGTYAESITTPADDPDKYGAMQFTRGVAEFTLKAGDTPMMGERLPAGLMYEVEELMTASQQKVFTALPLGTSQEGMIGENAESTSEDRYVSHIGFVNTRPLCKITEKTTENDENGAILYYPVTYQAIRVDANNRPIRRDGKLQYETKTKYLPAVYKELNDAFNSIQNSGSSLYYKRGSSYNVYNSSYYYNVKMLVPSYTLKTPLAVNSGKKIALTTAGLNDANFPRFFTSDTPTIIRRGGYTGSSMFTANGEFRLRNITLDGARNSYTATVNGGLVHVPSGGVLKLRTGSTLRNSRTSGSGGAVYVAAGGKVYLSGNLSFGGRGTYSNGSINTTVGNYSTGVILPDNAKNGGQEYTAARQDIYIAESGTAPASIIVDGALTGGDGTIWVWASSSKHYKKQMPFARLANGASPGNLKAFRDARPDSATENDTGDYLYGTLTGEAPEGYPNVTFIYWNGATGQVRVILRKVSDNGYDPLSGRHFKIIRNGDSSKTPIIDSNGNKLDNLVSGSGGIFYIGYLPYGEYVVIELSPVNKEFSRDYITVDEDGVSPKRVDN